MNAPQRSLFTEAIEDHLSLKKQNSALESEMPLARYDVGDPLDRYPGGPLRDDAIAAEVLATSAVPVPGAAPAADAGVEPTVGPTPDQALEAAHSLDAAYAGRPLEPLGGMTPMLSLVEDLDDEDDDAASDATALFGTTPTETADAAAGHVLRFPGGVGPRDEEPMQTEGASAVGAAAAVATVEGDADLTGEQPVIVVDAGEPLASEMNEPPRAATGRQGRRPRFFGLGRKKQKDEQSGDGWFTDGPRDFDWS